MWWHISESMQASVHLRPCAKFQPQDCWSFSAQNWFPASYFIFYIFLLPDHCRSAQPQPRRLSQTYWCTVGAVCVMLSPPHTHTHTHKPFVGSLSGFGIMYSQLNRKYIQQICLICIVSVWAGQNNSGFFANLFPIWSYYFKLFSFCSWWCCYVTSYLRIKAKDRLFLSRVWSEPNEMKSNPSLQWTLRFSFRVEINFGLWFCMSFRFWETGKYSNKYRYFCSFIYRWGIVIVSPLRSVLITSHHPHHCSVTLLLDKITTLGYTPSPPPPSLVPPTSTNHDPPMGGSYNDCHASHYWWGPPFPLGVHSLTFWQRMKVSRQRAGVGLADVGVKRPASSSGSG